MKDAGMSRIETVDQGSAIPTQTQLMSPYSLLSLSNKVVTVLFLLSHCCGQLPGLPAQLNLVGPSWGSLEMAAHGLSSSNIIG
jgi:hypothetical protein